MNLASELAEQDERRESLKTIGVEYEVESAGRKVKEPIIYLICRNANQKKRIIEVEGFRPSFFVSLNEFLSLEDESLGSGFSQKTENILTERRIVQIGVPDPEDVPEYFRDSLTRAISEYEHVVIDESTRTSLEGSPQVKIYTRVPDDIPELRDFFNTHKEADVLFTNRFLIDSGIRLGATVPEGETRVRYENWQGHSDGEKKIQEIESADAPDVDPRLLTLDIEVATEGDGFPDADRAKKPVTAISAHDNYTDQYMVWVLRSDEWGDNSEISGLSDYELAETFEEEIESRTGTEPIVSVYDRESFMLEEFNEWVADRQFDMITGWNSDDFDYPYLIKRSFNKGAYTIRDWSPFDDAMGVWSQGDDDVGFKTDGLVAFDMLDGYKKTQWQKLRSYSLDYVSNLELGSEEAKLEVDDYDDAWHYHPFEFMAYNVVDTRAVIGIESAKGVLDLFDNLRRVTGATYRDCHSNGQMIDMLFLRQAAQEGYALPTNEPPEQGNYHGAYVFPPVPGKHRNVVYPDLKSMYPYIMWTLNMSPETLFTSKEEYRDAGYTDQDVFTAYIDTRDFKVVPEGEEVGTLDPEKYKGAVDENDSLRNPPGMLEPLRGDEYPRSETEIYFLKPERKEGFIRKVVDRMVDLKYEYEGGSMYDAVKRVTNSLYGVLGDSASAGKGFRLFDWRIAEAITLTGRSIIQYTGNQYVELINMYNENANAKLVGGDTDSVITSVPGVEPQEALRLAQRASEEFEPSHGEPGLYDIYMEERFGVEFGRSCDAAEHESNHDKRACSECVVGDEHKTEVEIESLGSACFFVKDFDADENVGVKKRYAQDIIWDDSVDEDLDGWEEAEGTWYLTEAEIDDLGIEIGDDQWEPESLEDRIGIKGFEYVRSDTATITKEAQFEVFTNLLDKDGDEMEDAIYEYVSDLHEQVISGDISNEKIGKPKGMSKPLDEYGYDDDVEAYTSKPGPTYCGAKYADTHFDWEDISPGQKPIRLYIEKVRSDEYPEVYDYRDPETGEWQYSQESKEVETPVEAVSVTEPDRIPDDFEVDYEKMEQKELKKKLNPILKTIGMDWEHIVGEGRQSGLDAFM